MREVNYEPEGPTEETFEDYFGFDDMSSVHQGIAVMYYAMTTLTTVGFGDYSPRSDSERIFISFVLLVGVSIFSYLMGIFIDILGTRD